jgi:hypothetical protein
MGQPGLWGLRKRKVKFVLPHPSKARMGHPISRWMAGGKATADPSTRRCGDSLGITVGGKVSRYPMSQNRDMGHPQRLKPGTEGTGVRHD